MASETSDVAIAAQRRMAHAIHYNLSYIVQGAEHGTDGAIVLLHDIPAGAFVWKEMMPQLIGLNRAIYAIDMLGYGLSDHPWPADTSIWGHADTLVFLLKSLNLTNVILVGHGLGGGVAQVLATRLYRDHVKALVLIDTICYLHSFAENWPLPDMKKRQDLDAPKQTDLEEMIRDLRITLPKAVVNSSRFADVINDYVEPWHSELGKEVLLQHIRLLIPNYMNSVSSDLAVTGKPTLIIWGSNDEQIPVKYAERLHREIPSSRLTIIPNVGHLVPFDAPGELASILADFVNSI